MRLWVEEYRPKNIQDYAFKDDSQRKIVERWIKDKDIPHIMMSGAPGTGKTTLAKILINELDIDPYDVQEINASRENSVDTIRDKITGFVETMPFGTMKVVLLDEADFISPNGQAILRGVMESNHQTSRFILTLNYRHKIIHPLHSRCQELHIDKIDITEYLLRAANILIAEQVDFTYEDLDSYARMCYPDLRKCINSLQMNTFNGKLVPPSSNAENGQDWKVDVIQLLKDGQYTNARKLISKSIRSDEIDEFFVWTYRNLDLWTTDTDLQDKAIIIIRDGMASAPLVGDPEINLSATLCELVRLVKQ